MLAPWLDRGELSPNASLVRFFTIHQKVPVEVFLVARTRDASDPESKPHEKRVKDVTVEGVWFWCLVVVALLCSVLRLVKASTMVSFVLTLSSHLLFHKQ